MKPARWIFLLGSLFCQVSWAADMPAPAANEEKIARGLLMQHEGRLIFSPCRQRSYFALNDISPEKTLTAQFGTLGLAAGKTLYVEVLGQVQENDLQARQLNFARVGSRCQETGGPEEAWRAVGQGANWSLAIGRGVLVLQRSGQPELRLSDETLGSAAEGAYRNGTEQPTLHWRFVPGVCRSGDDGVVFGWQAELDIGGEVLKGCAWQR